MSKESATSKALETFKFDVDMFRKKPTNTTIVEPAFSSTDVLKRFGKTFKADSVTSTPKAVKIETSTQMTPGFADYCIGKSIRFLDGGDDYDFPTRNSVRKSQILQSPSFETTLTSPSQISEPIIMTPQRYIIPKDQLCKSLLSSDNKRLSSGDGNHDAEYMPTRSLVSKVSFKRKYKPLITPFYHEDSMNLLKQKNNITEDLDAEEKMPEDDFDKTFDKTLDKTFDKIDPVKHIKRHETDDLEMPDVDDIGKYSYYALFFMILSNLIGFGLSMTFQVLLFLKCNADRFLNKSWNNWKNAGLFQRENNLLAIILLIPVVIVVGLAYAIIWTCFGINKFLLKEVPDRVYQLICFNYRIVSK